MFPWWPTKAKHGLWVVWLATCDQWVSTWLVTQDLSSDLWLMPWGNLSLKAYDLWFITSGSWIVTHNRESWCVTYYLLLVTCDSCVAIRDLRLMTNTLHDLWLDLWLMTFDSCVVTHDLWLMISDSWLATYDKYLVWRVTYELWLDLWLKWGACFGELSTNKDLGVVYLMPNLPI